MVLDRFFRLLFYEFVNFEFFDSVSVSISRSLSLSVQGEGKRRSGCGLFCNRRDARVRAATTYAVVLLPFRRR